MVVSTPLLDHFFLLVWHAVLISVFFAFLWKSTGRERVKFILKAMALMVGGAVLLGWLMYPFP